MTINPQETDPGLVYIIGVDGTGKSTLIDNILAADPSIMAVEATSTTEAKRFKAANFLKPITAGFVAEREALFLGIAEPLEAAFWLAAEEGRSVITTGSKLVTQLSHAVMRELIGAPNGSEEAVVERWAEDASVRRPSGLVHVHAPMPVLLGRINSRLQAGDETENTHGFNSPEFLEAYQESWHRTVPLLEELGVGCVSIDTKVHDKETVADLAASVFSGEGRAA